MKGIRVVPNNRQEQKSHNMMQINLKKEDDEDPVHAEKLEMELKSKKRFESYKDIIYRKDSIVTPYYVVLYFFPGIINVQCLESSRPGILIAVSQLVRE